MDYLIATGFDFSEFTGLGKTVCGSLDFFLDVLPETPEEFTLFFIASALGDSFPIVGRKIFFELFEDLMLIGTLVAHYKGLMALPFV